MKNQTDHLGLERLLFFSDAIFAIAVTLLVLEIRLPDADRPLNNIQLSETLLGMWHDYLAYLISFLVIGTFWMAHHRKYRYIKNYDNTLLILNLLFLMVVAFMPFSSSLIINYPDRSATIFYALTMAIAGLLLAVNWRYASSKKRLIDPNLDARAINKQFIAPLLTSLIFFISIGISFLNENLSRLSWMLILFATWYANLD